MTLKRFQIYLFLSMLFSLCITLWSPGVASETKTNLSSNLASTLNLYLMMKRTPFLSSAFRCFSSAPDDSANVVNDLSVFDAGSSFYITWSYRNVGDYDQNGEVGVPDITQIANHYLHTNSSGNFPDADDEVIDGDESGEVGISDITPIASNYLKRVTHYDIQYSTDGLTFDKITAVPFSLAVIPVGGGRAQFTYGSLSLNDGYYRVVPYDDTDSTFGVKSNVFHLGQVEDPITSITISLDKTGMFGTGAIDDKYIFNWPDDYQFLALDVDRDITGDIEWNTYPPFAITWDSIAGHVLELHPLAGDFYVYASYGAIVSNRIYCRYEME